MANKKLDTRNALRGPSLQVQGSLSARPVEVLAAGLIDTQDAATVSNPDSDISSIADRVFELPRGMGTWLKARLVYDDGLSSITDPQVKLFGRHDAEDPWRLLRNVEGDKQVTLATASDDVDHDGDTLHTAPADAQSWDRDGCNEFVFGVETALAGTGDTDTATVQVWAI